MRRSKKGISEYVAVMILMVIVLAGTAAVLVLAGSAASKTSYGFIQQQEKLAYQAGEIVKALMSEPQSGGTLFLVEDVGNLPVTISQCLAGGAQVQCTLETPPSNSKPVNPPTMQPGLLYALFVQVANGVPVEIYTANGVLVELTNSGSGYLLSSGPAQYAFGTSSYQGKTYLGMVVQAFPLSPLNDNGVHCGSPYDTQGYTAFAFIYFTDPHPTVSIVTDDGMEVFLEQVGSNSWQSVFNGQAWHGQQGATPYNVTLNVHKNQEYVIAVQWLNDCGGGMSALQVTNSTLASAFTVVAWEWTSSSYPSYSLVSQNPSQPPQGAITEVTGTWG